MSCRYHWRSRYIPLPGIAQGRLQMSLAVGFVKTNLTGEELLYSLHTTVPGFSDDQWNWRYWVIRLMGLNILVVAKCPIQSMKTTGLGAGCCAPSSMMLPRMQKHPRLFRHHSSYNKTLLFLPSTNLCNSLIYYILGLN